MFHKLKNADILLFVLPILLWIFGCAVLWSLTFASSDSSIHNLAIKQFVFGIIGIVAMFVVSSVDYRGLRSASTIILAITILLLLAVELFGTTSLGATRWLDFKVFQLQPSEIAKISMIVVLGSYLASHIERISWKTVVVTSALLAIPLGLVLKQPDLGTGILLIAMALGMFVSMPLKRKHWVSLGIISVIFVSVLVLAVQNVGPFGHLLHAYQRDRLTTFINPQSDPLGKGYNVRQAVIAVGNGGLWGKGLGQETGQLSQLNFLPKAYTDFVFAASAESLGFAGATILLILFAGLLWRVVVVAKAARDGFGMLLAYGFFTLVLFSVLVNVGMNLAIMPVTGIPLPFISAGGTALIMNFVGVGLMQSIMMRRHTIQFS